MLLRTTDVAAASTERRARERIAIELGEEDEATLSAWVFETHGATPTYVEALTLIAEEATRSGRSFLDNLIEVAKKPKPVREAETELVAFVTPLMRRLTERIRAERGGEAAISDARAEFLYRLEEKLVNLFPGKHRATMKGAIVNAFVVAGGAFSLDVAALVRSLLVNDDPLKATASSSR